MKYDLIKLKHQGQSTKPKRASVRILDRISSTDNFSPDLICTGSLAGPEASFEHLYGFEIFHPSVGFGIIRNIYIKSEAEVWCQISCQDGRVEELMLLHKGYNSHPLPSSSFSNSSRTSHTESTEETVQVVFIAKIL